MLKGIHLTILVKFDQILGQILVKLGQFWSKFSKSQKVTNLGPNMLHFNFFTTHPQQSRKSRSKQKKINKERKHKSLSPEKRLANTLAQSMSSISKSFEKLDLVGHNRLVGRRKSRSQGRSADDQHNQKKQRRRSRPNADQVFNI